MEELTLPKQDRLIQTQLLPNMLHTQMPRPDLPVLFRLGEALEFPAELVHVAGVAKTAFSAPEGTDWIKRMQADENVAC
jgi:hypothetical protein